MTHSKEKDMEGKDVKTLFRAVTFSDILTVTMTFWFVSIFL